MPVVFLQIRRDGHFAHLDLHAAYEGFMMMGYEVRTYTKEQAHAGYLRSMGATRDTVVCGGVFEVQHALRSIGVTPPEPIDYPEELQSFLGRQIQRERLDLNHFPSLSPVFVKPVCHKLFPGTIVTDLQGAWLDLAAHNGVEVWFSTFVEFETEYRVFVRNGEIIGAKHYYGDFKRNLNWKIVEDAVRKYVSAPCCYALDFGRATDGRTLLVEANDFYSLGAYDLNCFTYASCIADRWFELTASPDDEVPIGS